ncbi:PREDICTED: protein NUCLEAR FUSION DEFECTIVE 4-like isoform X2 [Ipomoea nil]|uniref:protein NUCLEAR FUSION DEFECTIVE 4-like isoform X2 n=1 Tax=Ipomoea nil TaxID=35883 RepID=UPI0009013C98|nr:PREDICTED: protein NUCLEAR FUSION DEFECTIVE 4-like isoform X2 [Ipomoea nil]
MALQWLSLVAAIWLQSVNGSNLNFPAYSSRLKHLLSISQVQLNNLAFANDAGKLFGWFSGVAAAYLPLWVVLLIGSTLGFIGYGVQYLFLINQITSLSFWQVFLLTAMAGNSICWINTVCYIVAIKNFPLDRQVAVGLSTSYVGLSAKIFTDIVDVVNVSSPAGERAKTYLLLNAALPLVVSAVAAPLARDIKIGRSRSLAGGFSIMFVITIATGVYAVITSLGAAGVSRILPSYLSLTGMAVWLVFPVVVPIAEELKEQWQRKCWIRHDMKVYNQSEDEQSAPRSPPPSGATQPVSPSLPPSLLTVSNECHLGPRLASSGATQSLSLEGSKEGHAGLEGIWSREEIGAKKMVTRIDFWLYFFVYFFGATLGLVYMNNLGQIAESRGSSETSTLVSLSSSLSFFGRLLPSLYDYFSKSKYRISRPASIAATMVPMCGAFFLLLHGSHISLYVSTAVIGICAGAITSIAVSTTTELFGAHNFGVNHNILVTNIPIGSFLFGDMAALIYKREGRRHSSGAGTGTCMGTSCFHTTFLIWGCLCSFGTLLALVFHARTRSFYSHRQPINGQP